MLTNLPAALTSYTWRKRFAGLGLLMSLPLAPLQAQHLEAQSSLPGGTLNMQLLGTYATGVFDDGAAEIPAYDPATKRLFVVNASGSVDVLDIKNPTQPTKLFSIEIEELTGGTPNSVAVKNGLVAVAVEKEDAEGNQIPGLVAFFSSDLTDGASAPLQTVPAGALPDMLTFTPDGKKVLVANEGEPGESLDPEGSVTIVDVANGAIGATATTVGFGAFAGKEEELRAKGVRIFPGKKISEDFEPEYIAVSPEGNTAFITLQEANAFAVLDIAKASFLDIVPLGYKDYSRGQAQLKQYYFNEPAIGRRLNGDPIRFGGLSGLFLEKEENDRYIFVAVPDRGPNGDETPEGRPFLKPDYVAQVIRFALDKSSGLISILGKTSLKRKEGNQTKPITGFPNIPGVDEKPIDEAGNPLPYDPFGADLEGIAVAKDGSYWMVDEYRPAIYHFGKNGQLLNRFVPEGTAALANPVQPAGTYGDETLPDHYATRRSNRGFEAMALDAEKNILYAFIQTPLANPNRAASDNSNLIRILGINPATGKPVAEYLYVLEKPKFRLTNVDKIGDAAFDAKTGAFYVLERDDEANPENKKYVFRFDLKGATNLLDASSPTLPAGKTLEQYSVDELVALGIKPVKKTKVVNLPSLGYLPGDKPEGLTLLPDGSLAVLNDNDFGLDGPNLSKISLGIISFATGNTLDASDRDKAINLKNWPVKGAYMPDAIAAFQANGKTFYVTANEGDTRNEDERVGKLTLDSTAFPDASIQQPEQLGRLTVSGIDGDTDGDGDYDELVAYGSRSFSIWDAYGNQVYDSGDDFEKITAARFPEFFNSNNDTNNFDSRSDDKGPEPEGVAMGTINGHTYAFVGLERISGVMVYDVTNPDAVQFAGYFNNRNFAGDPENGTAGDLGPEGLVFIDEKESPNGQPMLVVSNEISGTTSIFSISKPQSVVSFTLVNADTNQDIAPLTNESVIDYAQLSTTRLNIRADVSPDKVGSVVFKLNDRIFSTENLAYYTLAGDNNGKYNPWSPAVGEYTLTATPYAQALGKGAAGASLTVSFKVVNTAKVNRFVLVDAQTGTDIQEIQHNEVIDLPALGGKKITVRAETNPPTVGSVKFSLITAQGTITQVDNQLPYTLFGEGGIKPETGNYTLKATAYAEANGKGTYGMSKEVSFEIVNAPSSDRTAAAGSQHQEGQPWQVSASPNPFSDQLTLRFTQAVSGPVSIKVYDMLGRQPYFETEEKLDGEQSVKINLSGLANRLYLLKVSAGGFQQAVKVVKE